MVSRRAAPKMLSLTRFYIYSRIDASDKSRAECDVAALFSDGTLRFPFVWPGRAGLGAVGRSEIRRQKFAFPKRLSHLGICRVQCRAGLQRGNAEVGAQ